jgi:hypothetical protein
MKKPEEKWEHCKHFEGLPCLFKDCEQCKKFKMRNIERGEESDMMIRGPRVGFVNWAIPSEGCFNCKYLDKNDMSCQNLPRLEDVQGDEIIYCTNFRERDDIIEALK